MPDGERLVVTTEGSNTLSVVEVGSARLLRAIETGGEQPHMVVVDRAGRIAWVTHVTSATITKVDARSYESVGELRVRGPFAYSTGRFLGGLFGLLPVPVGVQFNTAGDVFYVANSFGGVLVEVSLDDLQVQTSFAAQSEPNGMAWFL